VDESVRHLQDSSSQISLRREGAVPVWVGMGWLATKSGEVPLSKTLDCEILVDQTFSRRMRLWLISSVAQGSLLLDTNIRKGATAN